MSAQVGPGPDNTLDASLVMLTALRDACEVPTARIAADIAADLVSAVQSARQNKKGFKRLAEDSNELVIAIIENIPKATDVPSDLVKNLGQLVHTLASIQIFALKSASRPFIKAVLHSRRDAVKIEEYRERVKQSMRVFHLQSGINLCVTVAKIESQLELLEEFKKGATSGTSVPSMDASASVEALLPLRIPGQIDSAKGLVTITTIPGGRAEIVIGNGTSSG